MSDVHAGKTKEQIAEAYRSEPWWYDVRGFFILTLAYNSTLPEQMKLFGPNFGPRHLELACGTGTLLELLLRWRRSRKLPSVQIVGVDYAEPMLAGARHRFRGQTGFEFLHADAGNMPFAQAEFDTVNIANAIHCLPDVDAGLRETFRVLKPDGILAANALLYPRGVWPFKGIARRINDWGVQKGILYTPYEEADVRRRVVSAGFELVSESVSGNCYNVLARKPAALRNV